MKTPSLSTNYVHRSLGWFALLSVLLLMLCFGLLPEAQAISPPPGGCYPAYTTAEGCNALQSLATGLGNTGVGWYALFATSIGSYNTAVGAAALLANAGDQNTATGVGALLSNTSGYTNTADGAFALFNNTAGGGNIAIGYQAGSALTNGNNNIDIGNIGVAAESSTIRIGAPGIHTAIFVAGVTAISPTAPNQAMLVNPATGQLGSADISSFGVASTDPQNTAVGDQVLVSNIGESNTGTGFGALSSNTSGSNNTASGTDAMMFNVSGIFNDAFGAFALFNNSDRFSNNAFGESAMFSNITGAANTAVGDLALEFNDADGAGSANFNTAVGAQALAGDPNVGVMDGTSNNAFGFNALGLNETGSFNEAMGVNALSANESGASNVAIGDSAAGGNTSGSFNTVIGDSAGQNIITASNVICIGANVAGADVSNSCFIGSIFGQTSSGGTAVFIDGSGRLGTTTSSRRFKEEIKPMQQASEALYSLKPVTFRYKKEIDSAGTSQFGLVAEDVEKINPDLVVRDNEGKPYSVRYDAVNAMLLNEFLKEHRKVEEQGAIIAKQQKQIEALTAGLQKVSEELESNKPEQQMVAKSESR
jgi:trimeric autotransporter adhesin